MAVVESQAIFAERLEALNLAELCDAFVEKGWATYGSSAYSSAYTPGSADDAPFLRDVVVPLFGSTDHGMPCSVGSTSRGATRSPRPSSSTRDRTEDDAPRKVPAAEKEAHRGHLAARLAPGMNLVGELDPSYALIDEVCEKYEGNVVTYIEWEMCTTREAELSGRTRKDKQWKPDQHGVVRERVVEAVEHADVSTDLKLKSTLMRRRLALDIADVMSFETHQRIVDVLMDEYMRPPPHGYAKKVLAKAVPRWCVAGCRGRQAHGVPS